MHILDSSDIAERTETSSRTFQGHTPVPPPHHSFNLWAGLLLLLIPCFFHCYFGIAQTEPPGLLAACRLFLALGAALIGSHLGEHLKIKLKIPHIEAYGAVVLFLIVFLSTPIDQIDRKKTIIKELHQEECKYHMLPPDAFEPTRTDMIRQARASLFLRGVSFHQTFSNESFRHLILNHLQKGFDVRILAFAPLSRQNEEAATQFCKPLSDFTMDSLISTYKMKTLLAESKKQQQQPSQNGKKPGVLEVRFYESLPQYRFEYYGTDKISLFQDYKLSKPNEKLFRNFNEVLTKYEETEALWDKSIPLTTWIERHSNTDLSRALGCTN